MSDYDGYWPYEGKWALVTGAGRVGRVGADIAERLARSGANIYLHYRSAPDEATKVMNTVARAGGHYNVEVKLVQGDFARVEDVERVFRGISPEIVVNNAAIFGRADVSTDMDMIEYLHAHEKTLNGHWDANMKSAQLVTEAAVYKMLRKGERDGVVVYVGDAYINRGGSYPEGLAAYTLSKAHIPAIIRHYSTVYGRHGIRFLGVLNGPIAAPPGTDSSIIDRMRNEIPLDNSRLNPWIGGKAVAAAIDNLIRTGSANGTCIELDGGRSWTAVTEYDK